MSVAVTDGRFDAELCEAHGYLLVSVILDDRGVPDLTVDATHAALSQAGVPASQVRLVVHVSCETHGPDDFPSASCIQGRTVGNTALAVEIRQACNGVLAALELGAAYLSAAPTPTSALVTISDRNPLGTDRYRAGQDELGGDGATAAVLSRRAGMAKLLSTAVLGKGWFLDADAFDPCEFPSRAAYLAEQRRRIRLTLRAMSEHQQRSIETALSDAGLGSADISRWVFANVGQLSADQELRKEFGIDRCMTTKQARHDRRGRPAGRGRRVWRRSPPAPYGCCGSARRSGTGYPQDTGRHRGVRRS